MSALTITTLVQNYHKKVLKTQFLKEYSYLQNTLLLAKYNWGTGLQKYCTIWVCEDDDCSKVQYIKRFDCIDMFNKDYFKPVGTCNYKTSPLNYAKNNDSYLDVGAVTAPKYRLKDGACVETCINAGELGFTIDVNGSEKGPNAHGHDIFSFRVDKNDALQSIKMNVNNVVSNDQYDEQISANCAEGSPIHCGAILDQRGEPCTKFSKVRGNGLGCSWYAMHDICPDDETKGYWECLPN